MNGVHKHPWSSRIRGELGPILHGTSWGSVAGALPHVHTHKYGPIGLWEVGAPEGPMGRHFDFSSPFSYLNP